MRVVFVVVVVVALAAASVFAASVPCAVHFLPKPNVDAFLRADEDGFVGSMTARDLRERGATSSDDYVSAISGAGRDFSRNERRRLCDAAREADRRSPEKLRTIPWKLAKVAGVYDVGLPHTRGDLVFLYDKHVSEESSLEDLVDTLVHEKVHLYQRMNERSIAEYLRRKGYRRIERRADAATWTRANPDTDGWVYVRTDGAPIAEHPYEEMAYDLRSMGKNS